MLRRTTGRLAEGLAPPAVLVLSMTLNGGALASALRTLGYHPYTFETTFRHGHVVNHPREWLAVLQHHKPFDTVVLARPTAESHTTVPKNQSNGNDSEVPVGGSGAAADESWRQFDALVGPPATLAFEAILRACPLSTRVILVEEPNKAEWEAHMNLILQQVRGETHSLRMVGSARQLAEMVDMMMDIRRALGQRRERTTRQLNALTGRPLHNVSQGAALSLFEDHVREIVPKDRLLVYRLGDGWAPLCAFLGKPLPVEQPTDSALATATEADSAAVSTATAAQTLPFPVNTDGLEVLALLSSATHRSRMVMLVCVLCIVGFGVVALTPFVSLVRGLYDEEAAQYREAVTPYVEEAKESGNVSVRRMMIESKKVSLNHQRQYSEPGGPQMPWGTSWARLLSGGESKKGDDA